MISYKLKEVVQLQDIIKSNELDCTLKDPKTYNFSKYALPIVFENIYKRKLTLEEDNNERSKLVNELMGIHRVVKLAKKYIF